MGFLSIGSTISIFHKILANYTTPALLVCMNPYDPALASNTLGYLATPISPKSNAGGLNGNRYAFSLMNCGSVLVRNSNGINGSGDSQRPALHTLDNHGKDHDSVSYTEDSFIFKSISIQKSYPTDSLFSLQ